MKQVRETNAGKSISAWVILKNGVHVATIQAFYGDSGQVSVDVWHTAPIVDGSFPELQQGYASGYGYDKFTAALAGMTICGVLMTDHCATNDQTFELLKQYQIKVTRAQRRGNSTERIENRYKTIAATIGARFSNWDAEKGYWTSLYLTSGLDKLGGFGFNIIQAI